MAVAACGECDEDVEVSDRARIGQRVICPNCNAQLEVVSISPLELDSAYEDDEWEDDDNLDDDELALDDSWDDDELDDFDDDDLDDLDDDNTKW